MTCQLLCVGSSWSHAFDGSRAVCKLTTKEQSIGHSLQDLLPDGSRRCSGPGWIVRTHAAGLDLWVVFSFCAVVLVCVGTRMSPRLGRPRNLFARSSLEESASDLMFKFFAFRGRIWAQFLALFFEAIFLFAFGNVDNSQPWYVALAVLVCFSLFVQMAEGTSLLGCFK